MKVSFANGRGQTLSGRIDMPITGDPIAYALYAHCFTCTKSLRAIGRITATLAHHGIATLRFDFTGLGESAGDFADTNFSTNVSDLLAAADYLRQGHEAPEILIGHSLGGAAVLAAAGEVAEAAAVITIGAPASPAHLKGHVEHDLDVIEAEGRAEVLLAGRPFTITRQLLADVEGVRLDKAIAAMRKPLLVLHAPLDGTVGIDNAKAIFDAARHPKSFVSLDTADHLITDDDDARFAAEIIAAWADRYVAGDLVHRIQPDWATEAPETVTIARIGHGYRTELISNGFPLVADEPEALGGTNTGPGPYDYLLTALGSCTAMTMRMYADRKEWPLESATVRLSHRKIHARDCEACETAGGFIDHIDREITLVGALDDEQRARLVEMADRCPVHKTLHGEVVVHTTLG